MDPRTLRENVRAQIRARLATREPLTNQIAAARAAVESGAAGDVTPESIRALIAERDAIDAELDALNVRDGELTREVEREEAVDRLQREIGPGAPTLGGRGVPYDRAARIGQEARTYRRDLDPQGRGFLRDVGLVHMYGGMARQEQDRLSAHMAEERVERSVYLGGDRGAEARAAGTGAFAGLTVPQYLTEMYAPAAKAMRPFADACNGHPLPPDGMTLNISRITTATTAAVQASENSAVSETNIDDTLLTINVQTVAGQQTLSRQAIERGTGTEDVTVQDLYRSYATKLDSTLLNQATNGLTNVATSIAYTDASPTVAELYPKIVQGVAAVEAAMLNMASGDNLAIMHSRRWYWLQNALSTSWPLMSQPGIVAQMLGTNYATSYGQGIRGILPNGTPVVVDNNCDTALGAGTEDEIYLADRQECHLWEDPNAPVFIRAEQPAAATLGILFVLYGYMAYSFARYTQAQKIAGTGLIAPAFTGV
jgi:hypothetical protein